MATDGPTTVGGKRIERRRPKRPGRLPIETLQDMPALVVLQRLPAPALAVDRAGTILFANAAFCDMVGYSSRDELPTDFDEIFRSLPAHDRWIALVGTGGPRLVELRHQEGHAVWASMSKSAMRRRDDTVALVSFHDLTEELWLCRKALELPHEALARMSRGVFRSGAS
ncbi:PAS domain S-box protein [Mycobacterium sp. SP-6446]|uniref:PAS domain S-box protein n=1 Tax=Mycobacterium sp. SP-6446 TaxID=1834162 RepID=UPI0020C97456|nr:PAS domain-containing protein [Mycobacterium sp. SP-6446]